MPDRYFETEDAGTIADHLRLIRQFLADRSEHGDAEGALAPAIRWISRPEQGHAECWVSTWERGGLFSKIAGSFASAGLSILSANIYTRNDSLALDLFRVADPLQRGPIESRDLASVESTLRQTLLTDAFDFAPLLQKELADAGARPRHAPRNWTSRRAL